MALNHEADIEICGGWTRAYGGGVVDGRYWEARSSFRIKTDKRYEGVSALDYPVFPLKPHNKYRCWQVRNGGNDTKVGIFVKGTNGMSGNGQNSACNWNMDWERPVNIEYLVPEPAPDNGQSSMVNGTKP